MSDENFTLTTIYYNWKTYQEHIKAAIAPLTAEQLELRAASHLRSVGELVAHIIGCRAGWFTYTMGETGDQVVMQWREKAESGSTAAELVEGLDATWQMMARCLERWNDADMQQTFQDDWDGKIVHLSRAWIVYHVMEHDLHHGGELSLTLGIHNIPADFPG